MDTPRHLNEYFLKKKKNKVTDKAFSKHSASNCPNQKLGILAFFLTPTFKDFCPKEIVLMYKSDDATKVHKTSMIHKC